VPVISAGSLKSLPSAGFFQKSLYILMDITDIAWKLADPAPVRLTLMVAQPGYMASHFRVGTLDAVVALYFFPIVFFYRSKERQ
jgi:hypothetical protein